MTARSSAKRKPARRAAKAGALARLEEQLPATFREFAAELRKRLDRLERDTARAQIEVRKRTARLLREASHQLGRLEVGGEAAWRKLGASYQRELVALLGRLEKAIAPPTPKRKRPRTKRAPAPAAATD